MLKPALRPPMRAPLRSADSPREGVGYTFTNAEAAAVVARFTTQPDTARKALIDNLVGALKTAGVWSKLDALYILAAHDAQAARRNWIADTYNLTVANAPTFTTDRGYTGDGASARLDSGFVPGVAAGQWALNSASLFSYANTNVAENAGDIGSSGSTSVGVVQGRRAAGQADGDINNAQSAALRTAVATAIGLTTVSRTGASANKLYRGASVLASSATATVAVPTGGANSAVSILAHTGVSFSTKRIAVGGWGAGLSDTEVADLNTALGTYLTAVGGA